MQESKLKVTPADIQSALLESLNQDVASSSSTAASPDTPAGDGHAQDQDQEQEQGQEHGADGYTDGDLPDFSDEEPQAAPAPAHPHPSSSSRLIPGKGRPRGGKVPLAALKNRIQVGGSAAKKAPPKPQPAAPAPVASSSSSTVAATQQQQQDKGKGKGKAVKFSGKQLDDVAARIVKDHPELEGQLGRDDVQQLLETLQIDKDVVKGDKGFMGKGAKSMGGHKFWRTQPVPQLEEKPDEFREGPLEADKKPDEVPQEPVKLHKDFTWVTVDLSDEAQKKEVYDLLTHHYVEDLDASFRFDYSPEFIEWALKPPGYVPDWHVGIRVAESGKLVGFISGVPMDLRIRNATKRVNEINFLCVDKKLRSKRLAPLLIQEVTRRTHLKGLFQAIYTSGTFLPTPFSRCQYYHRNLNPAKLVKLGFSAVARNSTVARMVNHYRVPAETSIPGLRELEKRDLKQASRLLRAYSARFDVAPMLSNKDVEHALWDGRGKEVNGKREGQVTWSYVVEDPETHRITDVFSFYHLPSTAIQASPPARVEAAYLYFYATSAAPSCADLGDGSVAVPVRNWKDETDDERKVLGDRLKALMGDALTLVARAGFDVLNTLTIQDNTLFLEDLKFGKGDGFLHFYLYNYATKPVVGGIDPSDGGSGVGVIMLYPYGQTRAASVPHDALLASPSSPTPPRLLAGVSRLQYTSKPRALKLASLLLRTLSKPIATKLKQQAKEHEGFRSRTIEIAQFMHRAEMNLRVKLLGESPRHVRPLSESKAIDAGANFLSEGFLFSVAAAIIIGETWRGKRAENKRRDKVADALEAHEAQLEALELRLVEEQKEREEVVARERELSKVVEEIVLIGLHGGFGELPDEWKRHLAAGELARRFGTAERVLRDDDDESESVSAGDEASSSAPLSADAERLPQALEKAASLLGASSAQGGGTEQSAPQDGSEEPGPSISAA